MKIFIVNREMSWNAHGVWDSVLYIMRGKYSLCSFRTVYYVYFALSKECRYSERALS
jgi:hypothetical protein